MDFPTELRIILKSDLDGSPVSSIAIFLRIYAETKNDYIILLPNSDSSGVIHISKERIEQEISFEASTALMDYSSDLKHCKSYIDLSILSMEQIATAYENRMYYHQMLLFPLKYKMLELAENYKVQQEKFNINLVQGADLQIINLLLGVNDPLSYEKESRHLNDNHPFVVAAYGSLEEFKQVFSPANINKKSRFGIGLLHAAVAGKKRDIATFLIENWIDLNITDNKGKTALHYIADFPDLIIAKQILDNGGDINKKDIIGFNAFFDTLMVQGNNYELIELMLKYKPDIGQISPSFHPHIFSDGRLLELLNI